MLILRARQLSSLLSNFIESGINKSVIQNFIHRLDKSEQNDEDKDTFKIKRPSLICDMKNY